MKAYILILFISRLVSSDDYYQMLGVPRNADEKAIKKAFKKLSLEHHPDRKTENTEDNFMKLSHAYEVLTTPEKREIYDRWGEEGLKGGKNYNHDEILDNYFGHKNPHMNYHYQPFYENSEVINLNNDNVKNLYRRNEVWMVQFYGPRCRFCQDFRGEWMNLANKLSGIVKIAAVNCEEAENLCVDYNIKKYPGIIFFPDNTIVDPEVYTGDKNVEKMSEFALSKVSGFLRFVNFHNLDEFLQSELSQVKLLSFTDVKESPYLVKVLSKEFKGKVLFGEARATDSFLVEKFKISKFPALLWVSTESFEVYDKDFTRNSLESWIFQLIDNHKVSIFARELNRSLYSSGNCNSNDNKYCLIAFDPDSETKNILNLLSKDFEKDPVGIFWMNSKKYSSFVVEFKGQTVIYRGKKRKYMAVDCKNYACFKEKIVNILSGGGEFIKLNSLPEFVENKLEL